MRLLLDHLRGDPHEPFSSAVGRLTADLSPQMLSILIDAWTDSMAGNDSVQKQLQRLSAALNALSNSLTNALNWQNTLRATLNSVCPGRDWGNLQGALQLVDTAWPRSFNRIIDDYTDELVQSASKPGEKPTLDAALAEMARLQEELAKARAEEEAARKALEECQKAHPQLVKSQVQPVLKSVNMATIDVLATGLLQPAGSLEVKLKK